MPRSHSTRTYVWGSLVRLLSGYHPTLYSCQKSLPYLPLPRLNDTVDKFLTSLQAVYGKESDEFQEFETEAKASEADLSWSLYEPNHLLLCFIKNFSVVFFFTFSSLCVSSRLLNNNYFTLVNYQIQKDTSFEML